MADKSERKDRWVQITKQVSDNLEYAQAQTLVDAIRQEVGEMKLEAQEREALRLQMGADEQTASRWKTIDDVMNHIDIVDMAGKHPEAIKHAVNSALGVVGLVFPVVAQASGIVTRLPESLVTKIVQFGGNLTVGHLVHKTAHALANRKQTAPAQDEESPEEIVAQAVIEGATELTVVCKDAMLQEIIFQLAEEKNAALRGKEAAEATGGIYPMVMNEKAWLAQQKEGVFVGKLLFVGNIKGSEALAERIEPQYDRLGIRYGWSGSRAILTASKKGIKRKEDYAELLAELQELSVTEENKADKGKIKADGKTALKFSANFLIPGLGTFWIRKDKNADCERQQLLLGLFELFKEDIDRFLAL